MNSYNVKRGNILTCIFFSKKNASVHLLNSNFSVFQNSDKCSFVINASQNTLYAVGCYSGEMLPPIFLELPLSSGHIFQVASLRFQPAAAAAIGSVMAQWTDEPTEEDKAAGHNVKIYLHITFFRTRRVFGALI